MRLTRRGFIAGTGAMLATPVLAGARGAVAIEGPAFGASFRAVLPAWTDVERAAATIEAVIASVDRSMSPFRPESEIARFNGSNDDAWMPLSRDAGRTVAESVRIWRLTAGAFDPTVGGLVGRFGFGPIRHDAGGSPEDLELAPGAIRKKDSRVTLDLCGIAKGHALDRICEALAADGLDDLFVELGGEIRARGRHPSGRTWQAGIERPLPGPREIGWVMAMEGEALATSGDLVNAYEHRGRRYCHIIDPGRRRPASGDLASVSVFAECAATADALATALFAMGQRRGVEFADAHALPALFLMRDGSGLREIETGAFGSRMAGR
jgi:thiamine biosynthesis lipoprotein